MNDVEKFILQAQLNDCIFKSTQFRFKNIEIFRCIIPDEKIDSLHYKFLVPSNYDVNGNHIKESACLIPTDSQYVFDTEALISVLEFNENYFTTPLKFIKNKKEKK